MEYSILKINKCWNTIYWWKSINKH